MSVNSFSCPQCDGSLQVRNPGQSITIGCEHCGALLDNKDGVYQLVEAAKKMEDQLVIPLGTRGEIRGVKLELIGVMYRSDASGEYNWREYLLFNPVKGFRWLHCSDLNHWTLFEPIKMALDGAAAFESSWRNPVYEGESYRIFFSGGIVVTGVIGEFHWELRRGDRTFVRDYISPPKILSREKSHDELSYAHGEYIPINEIRTAFPESTISSPSGIAPNQPFPYNNFIGPSWVTALAITAVMLFFHIVNYMRMENKVVLHQTYTIQSSLSGPLSGIQTLPFELSSSSDNLAVEISAPVDNAWIDFGVTLVNDETDESLSTSAEVSYYHGCDSDECWSEGGNNSRIVFSEVPGGKYRLMVEPDASGFAIRNPTFNLKAIRGKYYFWNFFSAAFVIFIIPIVALIYRQVFESKRWQESSVSFTGE